MQEIIKDNDESIEIRKRIKLSNRIYFSLLPMKIRKIKHKKIKISYIKLYENYT